MTTAIEVGQTFNMFIPPQKFEDRTFSHPLWHCHLIQSERYIQQCEAQLARLTDLIAKRRDKVPIGDVLLRTYQRTLEIARTHHYAHSVMFLRNLKLSVLRRYRRRGKLLVDAKRISDASFLDILARNKIALVEATDCMALHMNWIAFRRAEQQNWDDGFATPANVSDALSLLEKGSAASLIG